MALPAVRIVQAALTNAGKHAGRHALVHVHQRWQPERLTLTIQDNAGLPEPQATSREQELDPVDSRLTWSSSVSAVPGDAPTRNHQLLRCCPPCQPGPPPHARRAGESAASRGPRRPPGRPHRLVPPADTAPVQQSGPGRGNGDLGVVSSPGRARPAGACPGRTVCAAVLSRPRPAPLLAPGRSAPLITGLSTTLLPLTGGPAGGRQRRTRLPPSHHPGRGRRGVELGQGVSGDAPDSLAAARPSAGSSSMS